MTQKSLDRPFRVLLLNPHPSLTTVNIRPATYSFLYLLNFIVGHFLSLLLITEKKSYCRTLLGISIAFSINGIFFHPHHINACPSLFPLSSFLLSPPQGKPRMRNSVLSVACEKGGDLYHRVFMKLR
jgi:hypothetical protein